MPNDHSIATTLRVALLACVTALAATGCVQTLTGTPPAATECSDTVPCADGESCHVGMCFGNPPDLELAAQLYVPDQRAADLGLTEIQTMSVAPNGEVQVPFASSVKITGRVVLTSTSENSVAATIVFRRPSRIAGLPDYVVSVSAQSGKNAGEIAFVARLSPNVPSEQYEMTVIPDDGTLAPPAPGDTPPNAKAPPLITLLAPLTVTTDMTVTLGGAATLKPISAHVLDAANRPMPGMQVTAQGRRNPGASLELASSTGTTDANGLFTIYVPIAWEDVFDIHITPGKGLHAPSLVRTGVHVPDPIAQAAETQVDDLVYPTFPTPIQFTLPVFGSDQAGGSAPATGALVTFTSVVAVQPDSSDTPGDHDQVTYTEQSAVDALGHALVTLLPGGLDNNRTYTIAVTPVANTPFAAVSGQQLAVGPPNPTTGDGGVLAVLDLPSRIHVTGTVLDSTGKPAALVSVTSSLSTSYLATLSADAATQARAVQLPEVITGSDGSFDFYLDDTLEGTQAAYDLDLVPPAGSLLPRWSKPSVVLTPGATPNTSALDPISLPPASLAWATVVDESGQPVANAEVRVYVRSGSAGCTGVPAACIPASRLISLGQSDTSGNIILVLPSP